MSTQIHNLHKNNILMLNSSIQSIVQCIDTKS